MMTTSTRWMIDKDGSIYPLSTECSVHGYCGSDVEKRISGMAIRMFAIEGTISQERYCSSAINTKEVFDMKTWNRWQELTPKVLGVLLIVVPFVFGITTIGSSSWDAWVLGMVVGVVAIILALLWFGFPSNRLTEGLTVMMGTVLFITPWAMDESSVSAGVWASCIIGVLLIVAAGGMAMESQR